MRFISLLRQGTPFESALQRIYGVNLQELKRRWRKSWRFRNVWVPLVTSGSILWLLAAILMVAGYVKRRRARKILMQEAEVIWEAEDLKTRETSDVPWASSNPSPPLAPVDSTPTSHRWSFIALLIGAGLTLLTTALLRNIWPHSDLFTLTLLTGVGVGVLFIVLWWTSRRSKDAAKGNGESEDRST